MPTAVWRPTCVQLPLLITKRDRYPGSNHNAVSAKREASLTISSLISLVCKPSKAQSERQGKAGELLAVRQSRSSHRSRGTGWMFFGKKSYNSSNDDRKYGKDSWYLRPAINPLSFWKAWITSVPLLKRSQSEPSGSLGPLHNTETVESHRDWSSICKALMNRSSLKVRWRFDAAIISFYQPWNSNHHTASSRKFAKLITHKMRLSVCLCTECFQWCKTKVLHQLLGWVWISRLGLSM